MTDPARSKVVIKLENMGNSSASLHSPETHVFVCIFLYMYCENIAVFFFLFFIMKKIVHCEHFINGYIPV